MKQTEIMEQVNNFFENEKEQTLFKGLGKLPLISNQWFYLRDLKTWKDERLQVYQDTEDKTRIRCKGQNLAFTLQRDNIDNYYVDHLLLGDIKEEVFDFSMRRKKAIELYGQTIQEENNFIVKYIDKKGIHIFHIENNALDITTLSKDEKEIIQQVHFYQNDKDAIIMDHDTEENKQYVRNEYISLEQKYPTITGYINEIMPIFNHTLQHCFDTQKDKVYQIERKQEKQPTVKNNAKILTMQNKEISQ